MPTNLISPLTWQSLSFDTPTAWLEFVGDHQQWHQILAQATGTRFCLFDDLRTNLELHARVHAGLSMALGTPPVQDLMSFDLNNAESWLSFHFLHAGDHHVMRLAAGL